MKNDIWYCFIVNPIFIMLKTINMYINNWGFSIIIATILIKLITYPLNKIQYISTLKINLLKPELDEIHKKYKDQSIKNEKIFSLYKKENISPVQGIILLIIQMPIFFSLYHILTNANEFNNAKFIFWITDLSSKDPYYVLPILMGISTFIIQKTSPSLNLDNKFNIMLIIIPILFTICFLYIPSGLVLYYLISNIITIIQQIIIYKEFINSKKYKKLITENINE